MCIGQRLMILVIGALSACAPDGDRAVAGAGDLSATDARVRLQSPRVLPVEREDWTLAQRAYLEPHEEAGRLFNVFKTAAHHTVASGKWDAFAFGHVNSADNTLTPRHRELLILRIGWLCGSEYEWAAHSEVARSIGFTEDELIHITEGPGAPQWAPFEATLLQAVDELHKDAFITDATWQALSAEYDTRQLMDLVFTVGAYNLVSMFLNSLGVQLDEGFTGFPETR
jgi:alkylhydroperoxidase family enzyme